jgi:DNA-3-methyladenine glycosylase
MLEADFFTRPPVDCARALVGMELVRGRCAGRIVETEAYTALGDEAAHTHFRPSAREFVSRHRAGTAYVYFNYGMYWLANVLIKGEVNGFVLIRALEPVEGIPTMQKRRHRKDIRDLCSGPGKLTIALDIDGRHHGTSFVATKRRPFHFRPPLSPIDPMEVIADARIGISRAQDFPWRFSLRGNPCVSKRPRTSFGPQSDPH